MWIVRAEIVGEFVRKEKFTNAEQALAYYNQLNDMGIWDSVTIFKA